MKLEHIVRALSLEILSGTDLNRDVKCGYVSDILSDVMARSPKKALWVTNQTHENILALVFFKSLSGIILPEGLMLSESSLNLAREKSIPVFSTREHAFDVIGRLYELGLRGNSSGAMV